MMQQRVPRQSWQNPVSQRIFLEKVAKELNIQSPKDWGKVTTKQIIEKRLSGILQKHKKSLSKALNSAFPGKSRLIVVMKRDNMEPYMVFESEMVKRKTKIFLR